MKVDKLYKSLGNPGRYHVIIYLLICYSCWMPVDHNHLIMAFYGAVPPHRCKIPDGYELNSSVPLISSSSGETKYNSCYVYENYTLESGKAVPCPMGWEYSIEPSHPMEETIVTEFDLVCDQLYLKNLATTIYFIGVMVGGILFGQLSDKWGRRPFLLISLYLPVLLGGSLYFIHNYIVFVVFRFLIGVLMQGLQTCSFVMVAELFRPELRSITGTITEVFWAFSSMLLALICYLLRDWHFIQLGISLHSIMWIFLIWVLPESPRWLVAKKKYDKAKEFFQKAAKFNRVQLSEQDLKVDKTMVHVNAATKTYTLLDLFRTFQIRKRALILFYIWFCVSLGYYGLSFSISTLAGNKYLNFFIGGAIELPAYIIATVAITKIGRKRPLIFYLSFGGAVCVVAAFIPSQTGDEVDITWLRTTLALIGRASIASCYSVLFLYTSELFPTVIRNLGVGGCAFWTRFGGVLSPQILQLGAITFRELPVIIFGVAAFLGSIAAFFLPETLGRTLPDTIDEAESFGSKKKAADAKTDDFYGVDNQALESTAL